MSKDPEKDALAVTYIKGYPSLASFIASDRDLSTSIYRRFDRLAARNLLYLQSELLELEARQDAVDADDLRDGIQDLEVKASARSWEVLTRKAAEPNNRREKERLELIREIREKVKEYREALILDSTLLSLPRPSSQTYEAFYNEFWNKKPITTSNTASGNGIEATSEYPTLGGKSSQILSNRSDLISLHHHPENEDRLAKFLRNHFRIFFLRRDTNNNNSPNSQGLGSSPLAYLSESRLHIFVSAVNILFAAVLLFGAIYNLYYVKSDQKRLGLIAGYTVLFAICMGLMTKARRAEIFGACSAYAAVLVVFVSGGLGTTSDSNGVSSGES